MLTGVLAASCAGVSKPGVPDRLIGLEKLKAGLGSSDMLELTEGDRRG